MLLTIPWCVPPPLDPPPQEVEGVSLVPCAGAAGHHGRQGVWRLAGEQGSGAIWQVHIPGEHGVNSLQLPAMFQPLWRDPHLAVLAAFQYHHGDGAGGASRRRLRMCFWPHRLLVSLHHGPGVLPPLQGRPAFPIREAIVQLDVEGVGAQLRRGSRPASGAWCRPKLGRWGDDRVCAGKVRDPYPPLVRLAVVERLDQHVDEVIWGSVCMSSVVDPGREGAGLGPAVGDGVVSGVSGSCLPVIASLVSGIASPGPSCQRNTDPAELACIGARVGNLARAASRSLSGTCAAMAGGVVVTLTALAPVSQYCALPAA